MLLHRIFVIRFFVACLLGLPLLAFAASPSASSPEGTVKEFFELIAANRPEEAAAFLEFNKHRNEKGDVSEKEKEFWKAYQKAIGPDMAKGLHKSFQKSGGIKSVETKLVSQEGDTAVVEFTMALGNGKKETNKINLVKEDGRWAILLK
ncbi:MAG: DUF4878 domain-containing protein [Burkholderiaceae bacterium]|jgi:hypothetical protein|nr:DUF4878 domain-containing protein [Burkholderiaceae bacterium]